jgi:hypothetical protein
MPNASAIASTSIFVGGLALTTGPLHAAFPWGPREMMRASIPSSTLPVGGQGKKIKSGVTVEFHQPVDQEIAAVAWRRHPTFVSHRKHAV